jgi:hypothetical protein
LAEGDDFKFNNFELKGRNRSDVEKISSCGIVPMLLLERGLTDEKFADGAP